MGTRMAPNYAIIFMHYLESNLLNRSTLKPKMAQIYRQHIYDLAIWYPNFNPIYGHDKQSPSNYEIQL